MRIAFGYSYFGSQPFLPNQRGLVKRTCSATSMTKGVLPTTKRLPRSSRKPMGSFALMPIRTSTIFPVSLHKEPKSVIVIGWITTRVILILVFYLVITPLGFAMRLFGKRALDLKFADADSKESFWNYRENQGSAPSQLERQF